MQLLKSITMAEMRFSPSVLELQYFKKFWRPGLPFRGSWGAKVEALLVGQSVVMRLGLGAGRGVGVEVGGDLGGDVSVREEDVSSGRECECLRACGCGT